MQVGISPQTETINYAQMDAARQSNRESQREISREGSQEAANGARETRARESAYVERQNAPQQVTPQAITNFARESERYAAQEIAGAIKAIYNAADQTLNAVNGANSAANAPANNANNVGNEQTIRETASRVANFVIYGAEGESSLLRSGRNAVIEGANMAQEIAGGGDRAAEAARNIVSQSLENIDRYTRSIGAPILNMLA
ncbi:MAG: hypothetical protein LBU73_02110 [Helicobacteraceae bacterium]|jgi:hypothetical protein|nr:hypothetical protein [Helicobacteraceae bacterium]